MRSSSSSRKRPRNQRVSNPRQRKQQHLLDVKVRARKATQYRNRRVLVFISKIALAAAICAGIYFGARVGMRRFFFENPDYRLTMIDMQTDGTLQRDQVLKIAWRDRHSHPRAQTDRLDHERKTNHRSVSIQRRFFDGCSRGADEGEKIVAGISWTAPGHGLHQRITRTWE